MNKETSALPVDRAALSQHYAAVESFQAQRATSARRTSKVLAAVAGIAILGNFGQAWTIASMLPLTKIVPVFLWAKPDGTIDSSATLSRLPSTTKEAVINAALWEYVRLREGYSFDSAQYAYDGVSGMSSDVVRAQYQTWFNFPNPQSPQVTVGRRGTIEIRHISSANISAHVQQIRYSRVVSMTGQSPSTTTWTATLQDQEIASLPMPLRLRNPGGVIVSSYQASEDTVQ